MVSFLINAIKIIFLLGFLIFIHEGGHFIVAKLCKVKVNQFAIGFGPTIWKKKKNETLYALRLIPLGGFVSMEGEEERSEKEGSFSMLSIPKRIAVVAAGALVNIIFALVVYFTLVSCSGNYISNQVEKVTSESISAQGLQQNDKILKVNGKAIHLYSDLEKALEKEVDLEIERNGKVQNLHISTIESKTKNIGIYFGSSKDEISTEIKAIYPNTPAEAVGLKAGDVILKVDGKDVEKDPYKVVEFLNNSEGKVEIIIQRKDETEIIDVVPQEISHYSLGMGLKTAENNFINNIYYGFWDTVDFSTSILENIKMMFSGKIKVNQLTGPIGISEMVAKTDDLYDFVYLLALISLSLGVTNILPFPPLDGGKIVIYIIEAIRRKPMNEKIEIGIQMAGFLIMILLSIYVAYNDILRIF